MNEVSLVLKSVSVLISSLKDVFVCIYERMCVCVYVCVCVCMCVSAACTYTLTSCTVHQFWNELASISFPMTCKFLVAMVTVLIWVGEAYEHVHVMVVLMCSDVILQA